MGEAQIATLRDKLRELDLDALLISHPLNRRYISGFTGSNGVVVLTPSEFFLVTDGRYYAQVAREVPQATLWRETVPQPQAVGELLQAQGLRRVGYEADAITVASYEQWRKAAPEVTWHPTEGLVGALRAAKNDAEIETIRTAQSIADRAFEQLVPLIQPGKTERELAWTFEQLLHEFGADGPAFPTTVASGPNSAYPHYRTGTRTIQPNEIVLVDFGARLNGYHSDCTRTLFTGDPQQNPEYVTLYATVFDALQAATAGIRPGVAGLDVDTMAREVIRARGHGEAFSHGLGHGIGLEVHELPAMSPRSGSKLPLPAESVVTIEPGIYIAEWGGIRLEDLVVVRKDGAELLSQTSKAIDLWQQMTA